MNYFNINNRFKFQKFFRTEFWVLFFYRFIGLFFIFAAISKSRGFYHIERVLLFAHFPPSSVEPIAWMLIFSELLLGVLMTFLLANRVTGIISFMILLLFSFFLTYLLFLPNAPSCGCTGNFSFFQSAFFENLFGVLRNLFFISIIFFRWRIMQRKVVQASR